MKVASRERKERGQAGIFVLLMLVFVLLGFLGLALDVGRFQVIQAELQVAADAAALAAATRLIGTANSAANAGLTGQAPFDVTNGNDNRFNLHTTSIVGSTDLVTTVTFDYFATLDSALAGTGGAQAGFDAKYVRVDITAESPGIFTRFLTQRAERPTVRSFAVAGISAPVCRACGIDGVAVTALDTTDEQDYGFVPGEYYTLYLNVGQQRPNLAACPSQIPAPLPDTLQAAEYTILNHVPVGPETDTDGLLFRLGAGGLAPAGTEELPGCITIGSSETAMTGIQGATCGTAQPVARNLACGLNTRFGVDPSGNACNNITNVAELATLFSQDADIGGSDTTPQNYQLDYDGNARRVITAPIVDSSSSLTVLNLRQFLVQNDASLAGINVNAFTGAMRAQYIGAPVPIRLGTIGGACGVTRGVGKVVLF